MPSTADLLKAALADRYRIDREIGQGGMATVYLAEDLKHHRKVAVKVLRPEIAATLGSDRFFREIEVAAQLQHPHILPLLDSGETQGFYYYVMPYVAGESLRERLAKGGELPIHDAVKILSEVVDALAAAHAMGVVHRDIKPDNVMLSGRHALVTDFGVAKAVSEATGRNQLTTAGVALGTPSYMAPEQAAADPHLDHRVDIYAVGAMGYELLTGKPPFTGGTAAEILGAHVTRIPEPVIARRTACPPALAAVIMRCLEKRPADRWQTAEELLSQLEPLATPSGGMTPTQTRPVEAMQEAARPKRLAPVVIVGALVAVVFGATMLAKQHRAQTPVTLRDRVQLTTTGRASYPAISPDGKQLAYAVAQCDSTCRYAVELKDVGGATTRRILDGATAVYSLQWSPDRRNLLFLGSLARRYGMYLISALGGAPRLVTSGWAVFWAGGDSLLVSDGIRTDSTFWLRIAGLDGAVRDSIRVPIPAKGMFVLGQPAGTQWIVTSLWHGTWLEVLTLDRRGRIAGRIAMKETVSGVRISADAAWIRVDQPGANSTPLIVRVPFTPKTGRLTDHWDTVYAGQTTYFDVTGDGGAFVVDEGSSQYTAWALDVPDALRGVFSEDRRLLQSTASLGVSLSPDGNRVLVRRSGAVSSGGDQLSVAPFGGGSETPLKVLGTLLGYGWVDSVTVTLGEKTPSGVQLSLTDLRTGSRRGSFSVPDSALQDWASLPGDAWSWIPIDGRTIKVQRQGENAPSSFKVPDWYMRVYGVQRSPNGSELAVLGWNAATYDTVGLNVLSLADGKFTAWGTWFGEGAQAYWLSDGAIGLANFDTQQTMTLYRVRGPGQVERLGTVPRQLAAFSTTFSADMRRIALVTNERRGDIWMSTVVRP